MQPRARTRAHYAHARVLVCECVNLGVREAERKSRRISSLTPGNAGGINDEAPAKGEGLSGQRCYQTPPGLVFPGILVS